LTPRVQAHAAPGAASGPRHRPGPCALVIFGASGDLAHRKLVPALYEIAREDLLPESFAVAGFARRALTAEAFREGLREAAARHARSRPFDERTWEKLAGRLEYVTGSYEDAGSFKALAAKLEELDRRLGTRGNRLHYLAVPPDVFAPILERMREAGLVRAPAPDRPWSRVIFEKPFGRDLDSAQELNRLVGEVLEESQTYRIDHYLGKETVQNLLVFRFGNAIFEPIWNRKYVDHVQITAAETIGVEKRGRFYDEIGVLRDVVQNHLLQVLALCAMEPPISFRPEEIRNQRVQVFRSLRPIAGGDAARETVRAQYRGYRGEPDVSRDSRTPTYAALRVFIDNWRWQGVPFYLRAGKRLRRRTTEVSIHFQPIPLCLFGGEEACLRTEPNVLTVRIQPDEGISIRFASKRPGDELDVASVDMDFSYARAFDVEPPEAYEKLLLDAMRGDPTLFARRDDVEEAWRFVTPILEAWEADRASPIPEYEPASAGPAEAEAWIRRDGRSWRPL
jgi:glucose-6-phosphate 1-dehydrogenase